MTKDDMEIVPALVGALADLVGKQRFEAWFAGSTELVLADGTLSVRVPDEFTKDWLRRNFGRHLESACSQVLGYVPTIEFSVQPALATPVVTPDDLHGRPSLHGPGDAKPTRSRRTAASTPGTASTMVAGSVGPRPARRPRRSFATFESLVLGDANRLAHTAAGMLAAGPNQLASLFVYGPSGVGKTALLEAAYSETQARHPGVRAVYMPAEQFTVEFVAAVRGGMPSFRSKFRRVELLVLDDVQFFGGKPGTVLELSHTVNTLLSEGRQVLMAADRAPSELSGLGPELVSRLTGGMVCEVQAPDYAMRLGILRKFATATQFDLPDAVAEFVAGEFSQHARELAGAVNLLRATATAHHGQQLTVEMARDALCDMIRHAARPLKLPDIERAVCKVFGIESAALQSGRRTKDISAPRMVAMWLARKHTRAACSEIGTFFGRRSHSTVLTAQKRVDAWVAGGERLDVHNRRLSTEETIRLLERTLVG